MTKKTCLITAYLVAVMMLISGCDYTPPYQRGYNEGYAAGIEAAGGDTAAVSAEDPAASAQTKPVEKSPLSSFMNSKTEEGAESSGASDGGEAGDETDSSTDDSGDAGEEDPGEDADASGDDTAEEESSEVLGEGQSPDSGSIPAGRIIAAEAVNEALFTNPEVIDGLRQIYPDNMIFGEFVGDSETNLLHRVGSDHFNQLGYNTIVVFDDSMSLQDILNEGFFTKCDCIE